MSCCKLHLRVIHIQGEFPAEEEIPLAMMPQTGLSDNTLRMWIYGLCVSLFGLGGLCVVLMKRKED